MEQEKNDLLLDDLFEARGGFDNIIQEMKDMNVDFPYEVIIRLEENSYANAYNAISRMNEYVKEYNYLMEENEDFFLDEIKVYLKGFLIYGMSIIALKIFGKVLSSRQINEMWYLLVGLLMGSVNMGIIKSNVNEHRYGSKDNREFMNRIKTLKESYKEDYKLAFKEVDYMFSLNRNLWNEYDHPKKMIKQNP